ncbi:hypothetical protein AMS68_000385 [Peltaster fructicola]|uniref:Uncharacterized protein n=1 Tax=Peltaster fructicola TaxID=286661 RepID=A0A6H0XJQ6_9PEZI|nr:hypothetical protein AMS68_000385 [Peltaster fructicola]
MVILGLFAPAPSIITPAHISSSSHSLNMDRKFSIAEPHPSVPKSGAYLAGGRGGAGNYKRYNAEELTSGANATGAASRMPLNKHYPRNITIGRGGAGNNKWIAPETEQSIFQFDEEMVARRESQAPVYHIGRGGAANFVDETKPKTTRQGSNASTNSVASNDSIRRSLEGVFGRLQRGLSRQS